MRIAFVGGPGFIGPAAVRDALGRGHEVVVLHRGVHPNPTEGASAVTVDRADATALAAALEGTRADAVVDTRAMTSTDAQTTVTAAAPLGVPLVVLSSQDVYAQFGGLLGHPGPAPEERITERSPLTVPFPYRHIEGAHRDPDYDKKDVERVFREAVDAGTLERVTILRLPPTYGRGDPARRFGGIVDALDRGDGRLPHRGGARWRWTHGHVDDVGRAIVLAAEARGPGIYVFNVGEAETPTMGEWAERFAAHLGKSLRWEETAELPAALGHLGEMPNDVVVDTTSIREKLGFVEVTSPDRRTADIVAWARVSRSR